MAYRVNNDIVLSNSRDATVTKIDSVGNLTYQARYVSGYTTVSAVGSVFTINCSASSFFLISPSQNSSIEFSNIPTGVLYTCCILIDNTVNGTAYTITWPASVKWPLTKSAPVSTNNLYTMVNLMYETDQVFYGSYILNYGA